MRRQAVVQKKNPKPVDPPIIKRPLVNGKEASENSEEDSESALISSTASLLSLLRTIGTGYRYLCNYCCEEGIKHFKALPQCQFNTGWVLSKIAKCYFEITRHQEARGYFEKVRVVDPYRLEDMEVYSTVLWHLEANVLLNVVINHSWNYLT